MSTEVERQLKRIADALERAYPKPEQTFAEPPAEPKRYLIEPYFGTGSTVVMGEGDWRLNNNDHHEGEDTDD